ncbi:MAG: glycosyltransferase [Candidatus Omnitrophica bacterium]|nr:glycosyltransferase [Candidatus Omnitrophota bacterium]
MKKLISVIIPAHNEEKVIAKAINSVLSSIYKNYEIIVVNDGSTDKTKEIVEGFIKKYPKKIRLLNFKPIKKGSEMIGRGPAFARNSGAEVARGDILFFLDADDWVTERTLEEIIDAFDRYKNIDFICGNRRVFIPKNIERIFLYGVIARDEINIIINKDKDEYITNGVSPCPYIMKKSAFIKMGFFDENFYYAEDKIFTQKLAKNKINKLLTKKIEWYTDYRSSIKDFVRQCSNVGRMLNTPFKFSHFMKFLKELFISSLTFPIFFLVMFIYFFRKTRDLTLSSFAPVLYLLRRIVTMYYFLKFR